MLAALKRYATPPSTLAGRLSMQSLIFASADGAFLAGSAVFFILVVGLSLGEVGLGLTIAAIASFVVAVPMGKLVDRFGPKRMWSLSAVLQGALFAMWPWIDSFPEYVAASRCSGCRTPPTTYADPSRGPSPRASPPSATAAGSR